MERSGLVNTYQQMGGSIESGAIRVPSIDAVSGAFNIISDEHHEVHEGVHFFLGRAKILALATNVLGFVVTTPNTSKWAHMLWQFSASGPITLQLYEGSTSISGGTALTPINSNRNSAAASVITALEDPTVGSAGTLLATASFGSAGTNKFAPAGGVENRDSEMILKQNTSYYWKITADDDLITVSYTANWYEHANVD